ncbi:hypothetical protein JOQ06_001160 [Pogonophryne albipinna]|uniref:HAT C-terminal dimerisation domain-containing protein n=1 Tax=Pogonophryne albipinna TaxID=1090488 RepID=A0AAD6B2A0_9TELE|nr:hypothetical protein JOQ06_001160 [Pogonophryne albipinna]
MLERFLEQYRAIQAASLDKRLRKPMERDRLARLTEDDFRRAEEFIHLMKVLYTSTLSVSSEKSPTCGQILPIFQKLEKHFTVDEEGDTVLVSSLKQAVWGNLSNRYQTDGIRNFLEEATALDPRFKHHVEDSTVWDRIKEKVMVGKLTESEQPTEQDPARGLKMTLLEELFAAEDSLKINNLSTSTTSTQQYQTDRELKMYQDMPPTMTSDDPAAWWWNKRTTYPLLSEVAFSYLCVQASSTPSERVFSTAGDTIYKNC